MPTFKALGLDDYIEVVVGREDVEQVKPDPELYLSAVQQLNYMPTQCLAIEDSVWCNSRDCSWIRCYC